MQLDAFQTIADPARRRILEALGTGEQQVNDVVRKLHIHQSGVSRHLRILHEAGFVQMRPDGQRRLYSLRPEPFREMEGWLAQYHHLWQARLGRFGDALKAKQTENKRKTRAASSVTRAPRKGPEEQHDE